MKLRSSKACFLIFILSILTLLILPFTAAAQVSPLSVITGAAVPSYDSATLNGDLTGLGAASKVEVYFEWGAGSGPLDQNTAPVLLASTRDFNAKISGLSPDTTYFYRAVARIDTGETVYGEKEPFTTAAQSLSGEGAATFKVSSSGFLSNVPLIVDDKYTVQTAYQFRTADGRLTIDIAAGTRLQNKSGGALPSLEASVINPLPESPAGAVVLLAYKLEPDRAVVSDKGLKFTLRYDSVAMPSKVSERDQYLAFFDGVSWLEVPSTLDTESNTISAVVKNFRPYALMGKTSLPSPTPALSLPVSGSFGPSVDSMSQGPVQATPLVVIPAAAVSAATPETAPLSEAPRRTEPANPVYWIIMAGIIVVSAAVYITYKVLNNRTRFDEGKF